MKRSFAGAVILAMVLCLSAVAHAAFSTDPEYIVVFQPGITWEGAAAEVAGWGDSFHLATVDSHADQRHVQSLIRGLRGAFWVEGYGDSSRSPRWVSGDSHGLPHWSKWERDEYSGHGAKVQPVALKENGSKNEHYDWRGEDWRWSQWNWHGWKWSDEKWSHEKWNDKTDLRHISGFIVEKFDSNDPNPTPTPVPAALWLMGSGLAVVVGVRLSRQPRRDAGSGLAG